jgi:hypothetical protein
MGMREVRRDIRAAMSTDNRCESSHVSGSEMTQIGKTAEKAGVTPGEARLIADILERGHILKPNPSMTEACPEHPADFFSVDQSAVKEANSFFVRNNLPYGQNEEAMRSRVRKAMDELDDYGTSLAKAPNVKSYHPLFIQDMRMVDGSRIDAFLNPKKGDFYLKFTGAGMGGPDTVGPFWHGPFKIDLKKPVVSEETTAKLRGAVHQHMNQLEWKSPSQALPIGVRFQRVHLMTERHPDGYSYTALIPVGALNPTVTPTDPNKAKSFYVERTGGIAGLTQISSRIDL